MSESKDEKKKAPDKMLGNINKIVKNRCNNHILVGDETGKADKFEFRQRMLSWLLVRCFVSGVKQCDAGKDISILLKSVIPFTIIVQKNVDYFTGKVQELSRDECARIVLFLQIELSDLCAIFARQKGHDGTYRKLVATTRVLNELANNFSPFSGEMDWTSMPKAPPIED